MGQVAQMSQLAQKWLQPALLDQSAQKWRSCLISGKCPVYCVGRHASFRRASTIDVASQGGAPACL
jgi:hypothetical protein